MGRSLKLKLINIINVPVNISKDINCEIILILPNIVCLLHPEKAVNIIEGVLNEERKITKNKPIYTSIKKKGERSRRKVMSVMVFKDA